jgi:hypothetical protein
MGDYAHTQNSQTRLEMRHELPLQYTRATTDDCEQISQISLETYSQETCGAKIKIQ